MRSVLAMLVLVLVGCAKSQAPAAGSTLEQQRDLALAVPADDVELVKAAKAAREAPLADRWVALGQLWVRKARATNDPGLYLSAQGAAKVALSLQPNSSAALGLEAVVSLNQHRFTEAREIAKQALALRADDLLALAALADATLELGDIIAATAAVQQMVDLKPNLPSYSRAAHLRWLRGDIAGAQALYRQAIDAGRNPRDPEPQAWVAVQSALVFFDAGDVDGADAGFDFALSRVPSYPPALVGKARVALSRGRPELAVSSLERAVAASPLVESLVLLAHARDAAGNRDGAKQAWVKAEAIGRASDPLALARGWAEAGTHTAEAVELLQHERSLRAGWQVEGALAWALHRAGDDDAAMAASQRALALGTPEVTLRFEHAAILAARHERPDARRELEALAPRVAGLSPPLQPEAKQLLGELMAAK